VNEAAAGLGGLLLQARFIDLILAGVALEACVLLVLRHRTGGGVPPRSVIANLAAGACLLAAMRFALDGGGGPLWAAACLGLALLAHVADLALRWERPAPVAQGRSERA